MRKSVRILRRAQRDLIEIRDYVALDNPRASIRLIDELLEKVESLAEFPEIGVIPRDKNLIDRGYRTLIERDYLIFYKVFKRQVRVYRIIHGRRKYRHLL